MVSSEYYRFVTRVEDEVYKEFAVQAESEDHARRIVDDVVLAGNEKVMIVDDVTDKMGEKQQLQDFINELPDADRLIVTGGKYVKTIEADH